MYWCPGAAATAVHVIDAALKDDRVIVQHDSKNAYNAFDRKPAFEFISHRPKVYGELYPLLNLQYAQPAFVYVYCNDGRKRIKVTSGSMQGCRSSDFMFSCATADITSHFQTAAIVDDMYLISKNSLADAAIFCQMMSDINLDIGGAKSSIIASPTRAAQIIAEFANGSLLLPLYPLDKQGAPRITSQPTKVVGGVLCPSEDCPPCDDIPQLVQVYAKAQRRCDDLLAIDGSIQAKLSVLKSLSYCYQFYTETFLLPPEQYHHFFSAVDKLHSSTFEKIVGLHIPDSASVRIHHPPQDRGIGLVPCDVIGRNSRRNASHRAKPFILQYGLSPVDSYEELDVHEAALSLFGAWKEFTNATRSFMYRFNPSPWNSIRRLNVFLELTDEECQFYLQVIFNMLEPFGYYCPLLQRNLVELSKSEFTRHVLSCRHCATPGWNHRHDNVATAITKTLRFHNISATWEPKMPLPGNERGGPDVRFAVTEPIILDVAVCGDENPKSMSNTMDAKEAGKRRKYSQVKDFKFIPFVMSIYGGVNESAVNEFKRYGQILRDSSLVHDIMNNTTIQMIKGMMTGYKILRNRPQDFAKDTEGLAAGF